ncbi:hypothetical protein FXO37_06055 [Capsicum annuum]|nr:hypothetical protein FXO37_06055 [Capsicum annuum]
MRDMKNQPTLKELQARVYLFSNSDVLGILDELLAKEVIELPKSKRPEESNKVEYPKYCKFHRIVSHHTTKCFILKVQIMTLMQEEKIIIDDGDTVDANHVSAKLHHMKGPISKALQSMGSVESPKLKKSSCYNVTTRAEALAITSIPNHGGPSALLNLAQPKFAARVGVFDSDTAQGTRPAYNPSRGHNNSYRQNTISGNEFSELMPSLEISKTKWPPDALSDAPHRSIPMRFLARCVDIALAYCFDHPNMPQTSSEKFETFLRHPLYTLDHESTQKSAFRGWEDQFDNHGS